MTDLSAYLTRIGHTGPVAPDLPTLRALTYAHATAIPFENLDPFSGVPVLLGPADLRAKLIDDRRGGYCFEHNRLLKAALDEIGFSTTGLQARVVWGGPDDAVTARGHKLLHVDLDGTDYITDVGFGATTLTAPLRVASGVEQETPHGLFRLVHDPDATGSGRGAWRQQIRLGDEWRSTYRFDLTPAFPVDDEAPNWFLSTAPTSHFVTGLTAARPTRDGRRLALNGRTFTAYAADGTADRRELESLADLRKVLTDELLIELPPGIDDALATLF
ncbi:arylamine N-acetyltransferase family protein [Cryptosporangium phraense]|uniref:Arylamine N-acetyltransferase n=1 Tax=Cryptosporangium phraense TaxID=2593070 RepID=A0A545AY46_9ACTN|nr:arylamine N-acetyltransferase [Cryptosporangium phraense]TQS46267.1 arylamine N-acetyltransferase [Cryptosporangium phraense]